MSKANNGDGGTVTDMEAAKQADQSIFGIDQTTCIKLVQSYKTRDFEEDIKFIQDLQGLDGIVKKLNSDKDKGISPELNLQRDTAFGNNKRDPMEADTCCSMFKSALDDDMLKLLMVCALVSITIDMSTAKGHDLYHAWVDGFAIMVAVLVVSGVGSVVDYRKEAEFVRKRNETEDAKKIDIIRVDEHGVSKQDTYHPREIMVGDLVVLTYGVQIPVDGVLVEGNIGCDESAMTGESDECMKEIPSECDKRLQAAATDDTKHATRKVAGLNKHALPSSVVQSGCSVSSGDGKMIAVMVGKYSCLGQIMSKIEVEDEKTPLYIKLEGIALDIGKLGMIFALLTFHVLMLRFIWEGLVGRQIDLFGGEQTVADGCSPDGGCFLKYLGQWFDNLIIGIVIIVVAVPEGLPLAVMITLAFSIIEMIKDKCDVKKLASCEIMGGANNICSDKTGTLTNNIMEVVKLWSGKDLTVESTVKVKREVEGDEKSAIVLDENSKAIKESRQQDFGKMGFNENLQKQILESICCNVPADKLSPTDEAMTFMVRGCNKDKETTIIKECAADHKTASKIQFPFTSGRKRMTTITTNHGTGGYDHRAQMKGASEIVLAQCDRFLNDSGDVTQMDDSKRNEIKAQIATYANNAYRTIALAYKDIKEGECGADHKNDSKSKGGDAPAGVLDIEVTGDYILVAILGIEDTIRSEVPGAISRIQKAGVTVRMVTGDNIDTAKAIAIKAGILKEADRNNPDCAMGGPDFYEQCGGLIEKTTNKGKKKEFVKHTKKFEKFAEHLVVLARSRPEDKYLMVTGLRNMGCTVAVTGDGTNDAPALRKSDVGFGMGIAGTDTCKEASDILITDDNFVAIVRAAQWGRNVYDNIQRFLQFQLSVNFVALTVTFVGSCIMKQSPLNAIQLLWVNLIMDSLAALALATGKPTEALLQRRPQEKNDYLVSRKMIKHIMYNSIWQSIILCIIAFFGEFIIPESNIARRHDKADSPYMYPGRDKTWIWDGEEPLYSQWKEGITPRTDVPALDQVACEAIGAIWKIVEEVGTEAQCYHPGGSPRHFTFFFTTFVMLQIFNMFCSRKIHDELNPFVGLGDNMVFLFIWFLIIGLQVIITQFTAVVFEVCDDGLDIYQWLIACGIGSTVLVINLLIKFIPDRFTPAIGKDTVFDRKEMENNRPAAAQFADK